MTWLKTQNTIWHIYSLDEVAGIQRNINYHIWYTIQPSVKVRLMYKIARNVKISDLDKAYNEGSK